MSKHVVEAEELQAYLDRELAAGREAEVERHLSECRECQVVLSDLKRVSEALQRWQVEPAPAGLRPPVVEEGGGERPWTWGRLTLALAGTAAVAVLVLSIATPNLLKSRMAGKTAEQADRRVAPAEAPAAADRATTEAPARQANDRVARIVSAPPPPASAPVVVDGLAAGRREEFERKDEAVPGGVAGGVIGGEPGLKAESYALNSAVGPQKSRAKTAAEAARLIAYQVAMTLEVKDFPAAKAKLEKTVAEAGGYVAQASAAETPNQPRRADLVVRVPVEKLSAVLDELRGLGRVLNEQLSTDEVTEQVVDLEARLRNARATEQRLVAVLSERTGKVRDILEVEREIARTRQGIEQMEARRQNLLHRLELATLSVALVEEFKAQLAPAPVGTGTRLHNAFVDGYQGLVDTLLGFVFFFARYGLSLLFWWTLLWLGWRLVRRPLWRLVGTRG